MRNGLKALLMCVVMAIVWSNTGVVAAPPVTRSYVAGKFALEIDGNVMGFVNAVEGMDSSLYNWIALALQGQHVRLSGAIVGVNFNGDVVSRLEFLDALITEVAFPALDAASKDAAKLSIVLSPDQTVVNRKTSGKLSVKTPSTQKRWLSSSFRLSIDGFDSKKVSKIEALTVKLPRPACFRCEDPSEPTKVDFPHVVVTVGEPAESVYDWLEDFVIKGNNDDSQEKGGELVYLAPDLKTPLFILKFSHLGIFEVMPIVADAGGSSVPRLLAAMYCESIVLQVQ